MEFKSKFFGWIALLFIQAVGVAQTPETVTLTIKQAEELFFKNNFMLLAQQYNIDRAGAAVIQSKVYPNPEITADMVAYQGQENYISLVGTMAILLPVLSRLSLWEVNDANRLRLQKWIKR